VCAPDIILEDKEEIVGVFGTKDYKFVENFNAMHGFILWKPQN
jgi:hypothetical protein